LTEKDPNSVVLFFNRKMDEMMMERFFGGIEEVRIKRTD
jgi:hypothetical protein